MPLELGAVGKRVATQRAGEVLLVLLVAVLDVLLQGCQALVAPVAVGAGQQLGKSIWSSRWQVIFFLPIGLGRAKARQLLGGLWVNDGRVAALKVFLDADRVYIAFLQFPGKKWTARLKKFPS